jgi:hypothetical protein
LLAFALRSRCHATKRTARRFFHSSFPLSPSLSYGLHTVPREESLHDLFLVSFSAVRLPFGDRGGKRHGTRTLPYQRDARARLFGTTVTVQRCLRGSIVPAVIQSSQSLGPSTPRSTSPTSAMVPKAPVFSWSSRELMANNWFYAPDRRAISTAPQSFASPSGQRSCVDRRREPCPRRNIAATATAVTRSTGRSRLPGGSWNRSRQRPVLDGSNVTRKGAYGPLIPR